MSFLRQVSMLSQSTLLLKYVKYGGRVIFFCCRGAWIQTGLRRRDKFICCNLKIAFEAWWCWKLLLIVFNLCRLRCPGLIRTPPTDGRSGYMTSSPLSRRISTPDKHNSLRMEKRGIVSYQCTRTTRTCPEGKPNIVRRVRNLNSNRIRTTPEPKPQIPQPEAPYTQ